MTAESRQPEAGPALRLEGELTIFRAAEIKPLLLATPPPCELQLDGVTEIDTAGLQLLMLARREALAQQRGLRLLAASPPVVEAIHLLHLAPYFGDSLVTEPVVDAVRSHHES